MKPRFAVLLEDAENAQHGKLSFVSYFLQDETDPSLTNWNGSFMFKNGSGLFFTISCGDKYPDEVPIINFEQVPRVTSKISLNGTQMRTDSQVCKEWLKIDHNKRNLDELLTLVFNNLK